MSQCLVDANALTLYDPEENREVVHFFRARQDGSDRGQAERITHQRLAELLCMDGHGYELALARFDKLCRGERLALMSLYEYWLDPADAEAVERNNAAALEEFATLVDRAQLSSFDRVQFETHKEGSSWKGIAKSIRKLTTSTILNEKYERDVVTKAHLLALADAFEDSNRLARAA